jgi:Ca-activated chloride channel family protein
MQKCWMRPASGILHVRGYCGAPMRLRLALLAVVLTTSSLPGAAQDRSASFVSTSSELVVLPVTVSNKQGGLVADLPQDRFVVFDNGRRQEVALFSNEDTPVTVGLVIDTSGSMKAKLPEVIIAAATFKRRSNPQDEMFVVAFNDTVIEHGPGAASPASDDHALESDLRSLVAQGRTALYDGLSAGLDRMALAMRPRKALIVVSDGADNASRSTLEQVLTTARRSNVTIYTVGLFDLDGPDKNPGVLKSLAQSTGGDRFLPRSPSELVQACERIARELRSGYTIGYPPPDRDGAFHRIRVQVTSSGSDKLQVRTRPGYFAANQAARP